MGFRPRRSLPGPAFVLSLGFTVAASALGGMYLFSFFDPPDGSKRYAALGLLVGLFAGFVAAWARIKPYASSKKVK